MIDASQTEANTNPTAIPIIFKTIIFFFTSQFYYKILFSESLRVVYVFLANPLFFFFSNPFFTLSGFSFSYLFYNTISLEYTLKQIVNRLKLCIIGLLIYSLFFVILFMFFGFIVVFIFKILL